MAEPPDVKAAAAAWLEAWEEHVRRILSPDGFGTVLGARHGRGETGPATSAAAPDHGDGDLAELRRRIAALEERLAALERSSGEQSRKRGGRPPRKPSA